MSGHTGARSGLSTITCEASLIQNLIRLMDLGQQLNVNRLMHPMERKRA